ncbi:MAG TPA: hypothetical protein VGJ26_12070 [Pirellulales bacterium]|jgi:hypothetical protein
MLRARLQWMWLGLCAVLLGPVARGAEFVDFHVESKLYKAKDEKPINEITTIFRSGFVYDFITDPNKKLDPETTIFDSLRGRFVVIDPQRKVWSQVSTEALKTFSAKVKLDAAAAPQAVLNFMANPKFNEETEGEGMVFKSHWMEYRLRAAPAKSPRAVEQYAEFSQWSAQLNVMLTGRGTLPPFPRMTISRILAERGLLPTDVQMTLDADQPGVPKYSLRATHRFQWTLLEPDRQRIDEAGRQMAAFRELTLEDYILRGKQETAARPAAEKRK